MLLCRVLGHLAPLHRCARSVRCPAFAVSWATWPLFTVVLAQRVVLRVPCTGPLGSCSRECLLGVLCCVCAVSWPTWLLFTGVLARCVVLHLRCPRPLGPCSPVCPLGALSCVCGVLSHLAPVHQCARLVCCVVVWCPGPLGFCCARSVCGVACAVSWAPWLLFSGVLAPPVVWRVRCPRAFGSCSPVCLLGVLCCVSCVRCPRALGPCSPPCALGVLCCVCGALLRGAHSSIRTAAIRSRQGLCTPEEPTRPSARRLFRSRQGLGRKEKHHATAKTVLTQGKMAQSKSEQLKSVP